MGNKLCKKKVDSIDSPKSQPTPFDRIINRLHLKPKWKSDSHLEEKQVNRYEVNPKNGSIPQRPPRPLSNAKSSDWTEVSLEVPDDNEVQLKDAKLSLIFNNDSTPTPPPRKHKKGIRERIEAVAKSGLQALQTKKPVEEPLCVKKTIIYGCPHDEIDHANHNRSHKHEKHAAPKHTSTPKSVQKLNDKEMKRKKNLSIVSLPNYSELKFSLANNDDSVDKKSDSTLRKSIHSLPGETKKLSTYNDKRDYIARCRSFGSSLPQLLLHKLTNAKAPLAEIESDDSFGGLEDWDLKIIEHYNPKDSSLPRNVRPPKSEKDMLTDIESLIVQEEDIAPPRPPVRRSESLVKKIHRNAAENAHKRTTEALAIDNTDMSNRGRDTPTSLTPPPSPEKIIDEPFADIPISDLPTKDEEGNVEHSSLMRILQEFSFKSVQEGKEGEKKLKDVHEDVNENYSSTSMTPPPLYQCRESLNPVDNFLNAERANSNYEFTKLGNTHIKHNADMIRT